MHTCHAQVGEHQRCSRLQQQEALHACQGDVASLLPACMEQHAVGALVGGGKGSAGSVAQWRGVRCFAAVPAPARLASTTTCKVEMLLALTADQRQRLAARHVEGQGGALHAGIIQLNA